MSDTPSFTKKLGRQYYQKRPGVTMRVKIPPKPPIPCGIWDRLAGVFVTYNPISKKVMPLGGVATIFPSRAEARTALWHICQNLKNAGLADMFNDPPNFEIRDKPDS